MRDLKRSRAKRDPERTPEPFGDETPQRVMGPDSARAFVVQQHAARRMHWDLRLEIGGVLVSWAVPKGPSLDSSQRRLAVQTEDHPLEYADFEGVIPADNYGAGAMIVWDRGFYRSVDGTAPSAGLESGKLDLALEGHKLRGRFALVRTRDADGRNWLLLYKGAAPETGAEPIESEPYSVLSGLTVEELREGVSRDRPVAAAARRASAPQAVLDDASLRPMLAEKEDEPFSRPGWLFELKYDGVRALVAREKSGDVRIFTRTGRDRTSVYPEIAHATAHLPLSEFVIDGELVALDARGRSSFERLQRRFTQTDPDAIARARAEFPVVLYAFDCLHAAGHDLKGLPLRERKAVLARFAPRSGVVRFADHVEGDGEALFAAAREHGLEGVVAKQADSAYEMGRRSPRWLKVKVPRSGVLAIVGFTAGRGSRSRLGSLLLAWHRDGEFVYAGNAGSGLSDATIDALLRKLGPAQIAEPPFRGAPEARGTRYVQPELACE
ncbi:MAG: non-homologous end-joining DNA ligase, partial [Myxococcota bacterium]